MSTQNLPAGTGHQALRRLSLLVRRPRVLRRVGSRVPASALPDGRVGDEAPRARREVLLVGASAAAARCGVDSAGAARARRWRSRQRAPIGRRPRRRDAAVVHRAHAAGDGGRGAAAFAGRPAGLRCWRRRTAPSAAARRRASWPTSCGSPRRRCSCVRRRARAARLRRRGRRRRRRWREAGVDFVVGDDEAPLRESASGLRACSTRGGDGASMRVRDGRPSETRRRRDGVGGRADAAVAGRAATPPARREISPAALRALAALGEWCLARVRCCGTCRTWRRRRSSTKAWRLERFPRARACRWCGGAASSATRRAWVAAYEWCDVLSVEARVPGLAAHATEPLASWVLPALDRAMARRTARASRCSAPRRPTRSCAASASSAALRWRALLVVAARRVRAVGGAAQTSIGRSKPKRRARDRAADLAAGRAVGPAQLARHRDL